MLFPLFQVFPPVVLRQISARRGSSGDACQSTGRKRPFWYYTSEGEVPPKPVPKAMRTKADQGLRTPPGGPGGALMRCRGRVPTRWGRTRTSPASRRRIAWPAWCAVALGSTPPGAAARRIAAGSPRATATATWASAFSQVGLQPSRRRRNPGRAERASVRSAAAGRLVPPSLELRPSGRTFFFGRIFFRMEQGRRARGRPRTRPHVKLAP